MHASTEQKTSLLAQDRPERGLNEAAPDPRSVPDEMSASQKAGGAHGGGRRKEGNQKPRHRGGEPSGSSTPKLRGSPRESDETRRSKTLTWILRHGSQSEQLFMRPDGYVRVQDILARPRFKEFDMATIERIVANDSKTRFNLANEPDPTTGESVWWIRANQGHSMKEVVGLETTPIRSVADIPTGVAVHGTSRKAWDSIHKEGLSRMKRNHIHLAQGIPGSGVISGMRNPSQILIFVDVDRAITAGIKFDLSSNGVVLTAGDKKGLIPPAFFREVVSQDGKVLLKASSLSLDTNVEEIRQKAEALVL